MTNPHPAQVKWKDPLALARDIRKRLHLIADTSVRLDMEACCDAIEQLGADLEHTLVLLESLAKGYSDYFANHCVQHVIKTRAALQ